eukprot:1138877-Pelagomonas_calceolata.AAC.10
MLPSLRIPSLTQPKPTRPQSPSPDTPCCKPRAGCKGAWRLCGGDWEGSAPAAPSPSAEGASSVQASVCACMTQAPRASSSSHRALVATPCVPSHQRMAPRMVLPCKQGVAGVGDHALRTCCWSRAITGGSSSSSTATIMSKQQQAPVQQEQQHRQQSKDQPNNGKKTPSSSSPPPSSSAAVAAALPPSSTATAGGKATGAEKENQPNHGQHHCHHHHHQQQQQQRHHAGCHRRLRHSTLLPTSGVAISSYTTQLSMTLIFAILAPASAHLAVKSAALSLLPTSIRPARSWLKPLVKHRGMTTSRHSSAPKHSCICLHTHTHTHTQTRDGSA